MKKIVMFVPNYHTRHLLIERLCSICVINRARVNEGFLSFEYPAHYSKEIATLISGFAKQTSTIKIYYGEGGAKWDN